jgi:hypothetical protein
MEASSNNNKSNDERITRDPRNGAFTFQVHAEYDLLLQIQKDLDKAKQRPKKSSRSSLNSLALSDIESTQIILKSVDDYCYGKQWMYHIGSEKGEAISRFLRSGVDSWRKKRGDCKKVCVSILFCFLIVILYNYICPLTQSAATLHFDTEIHLPRLWDILWLLLTCASIDTSRNCQ